MHTADAHNERGKLMFIFDCWIRSLQFQSYALDLLMSVNPSAYSLLKLSITLTSQITCNYCLFLEFLPVYHSEVNLELIKNFSRLQIRSRSVCYTF